MINIFKNRNKNLQKIVIGRLQRRKYYQISFEIKIKTNIQQFLKEENFE